LRHCAQSTAALAVTASFLTPSRVEHQMLGSGTRTRHYQAVKLQEMCCCRNCIGAGIVKTLVTVVSPLQAWPRRQDLRASGCRTWQLSGCGFRALYGSARQVRGRAGSRFRRVPCQAPALYKEPRYRTRRFSGRGRWSPLRVQIHYGSPARRCMQGPWAGVPTGFPEGLRHGPVSAEAAFTQAFNDSQNFVSAVIMNKVNGACPPAVGAWNRAKG